MNSKNNALDISYYRLSLTDFLKESHPELLIDNAFIAERSETAVETYIPKPFGTEAIRLKPENRQTLFFFRTCIFPRITRCLTFFGMSFRI
jgi:hypothetical protein